MNQDRVPFDELMYSNAIDYITGYMNRKDFDLEQAVAKVERDLRMMLDQKFRSQ